MLCCEFCVQRNIIHVIPLKKKHRLTSTYVAGFPVMQIGNIGIKFLKVSLLYYSLNSVVSTIKVGTLSRWELPPFNKSGDFLE